MNNAAPFPSSVNGWGNKRTFTLGLQNVNPHSEMLDVLSEVFEKPHATELQNLSDYTRPSRCQIPRFLPSLQDFTDGFWNLPKTTMLECHANLFLTETPCQLLEKATLARIMFNWLTKNSYESWTGVEHTSECWHRGNSPWISSDHTMTRPWRTDTCYTF